MALRNERTIMPALVMRILRTLLFLWNSATSVRTLSRGSDPSKCPGFKMSDKVDSPFAMSRTPKKSLAAAAL